MIANSSLKHMLHPMLRPISHLVILCAVMFNTSVPAGAMLERGMDGKIRIAVCTAQGMLNAWLDVQTGQLVEEDDHKQSDDEQNRLDCQMVSPAPIANSDASSSVKLAVRIAQPFRTEMAGTKLVIGQSPARLSARGPPISI